MSDFQLSKEAWDLLLEKIDAVGDQVTTVDDKIGDVNKRVTSLEQFKMKLLGMVSILAVLWGVLGERVSNFIFGSSK